MLDVSKMEQFIETIERRDTERCAKLSRFPDELHSSQATLKAMLDGTRTLVVLLDTQGLVVDANRIAFALVGASIEQVVDVPFENTAWCTCDAVQVERVRESINRASRGELVHVDLTQYALDDDLRILEFEITPFRDEFGAITWLVAEGHDVTELRRSEVEHGDLEQRLQHSERLEFVGRLAVGVAHDFNNLLTVMGSGLDMLRAEENHDPLNRAILDDMCEAVHSATALARQLLAFGRRQVTTPEDFVVDEWVQSIAQMWRKVLSDTIVLTVELNAPDSSIRMSKGHYEQILVNLIVNAQDAMPKGGNMTLRTEYKSFDSLPRQAIGQRQTQGPHVVTTLTDTGCGMSSETLHKAFDLFFTTKSKGTGFGLATVYGLVTQAGGFVTLESTQGEGTCVGICLPLMEVETAPMVTLAPESCDRRSSTVLLVDDDTKVREAERRMLKQLG
jgi:PAS domain S-box-containing protein